MKAFSEEVDVASFCGFVERKPHFVVRSLADSGGDVVGRDEAGRTSTRPSPPTAFFCEVEMR